jgi:hypothetical protein
MRCPPTLIYREIPSWLGERVAGWRQGFPLQLPWLAWQPKLLPEFQKRKSFF